MDIAQDEQNASSAMDTSPVQNHPSDSPTAFVHSQVSLSSPRPDVASSPSSVALLSHDSAAANATAVAAAAAATAAFPDKLDAVTSLHVGSAGMVPVDMSVDGLGSAAAVRAPAPGFIPDFPLHPPAFGSPRMNHLVSGQSPSTATTTTSSSHSAPSHLASPTIHGLSPSYSAGTSSLASALDSIGVSASIGRNRSESSGSPANPASSSSELGYSPAGSGSAGHDFFPGNDYQETRSGSTKEGSPDFPDGGHLLAVGNLLSNVISTAQSARDACTMGQSTTATLKISELKRTADLIQVLMASTQLVDGPSSPQRSSHHGMNGVRSSGSPSGNMAMGSIPAAPPDPSLGGATPQHFSSSPPAPVDIGAMDVQGVFDPFGNESRKRCASSLTGDRSMKAPKLEPIDDAALHLNPSTNGGGNASQQHMTPLQMFPPISMDPRTLPPFSPSNGHPPSEPTSRPPSPSGLASHQSFNILGQQQPSHNSVSFGHLGMSSNTLTAAGSFDSSPPTLSSTPTQLASATNFPPSLSQQGSAWSDSAATFPTRHHHSTSSTSSINGNLGLHQYNSISSPLNNSVTHYSPAGTFVPPLVPGPADAAAPIGRISRSGSVNGGVPGNPFAFTFPNVTKLESFEFGGQPSAEQQPVASSSRIALRSAPGSPDSSDDDEGFESESPPDRKRRGSGNDSYSRPTTSQGFGSGSGAGQISMDGVHDRPGGHGNEVPHEYRTEVDRIFFEFLNKICSNLDATDAKGEPIHQTLMAKKMQRLDESPDFRPFKFRIQAFTNAFLEELARQGYPEEKIPMKKIRNYLWAQPYISRFNEDGKKAKSKGNHIWNIDAKKASEGGWIFRPFQRRLAGSPPGVAYVGLRWHFTPRIWDPWGSKPSHPVKYSCPCMPSWLSWKDDTLSGIPPPDAESCDITVEAKFIQDGQEEYLSQTFHLNIAPMSTLESPYAPSRRPSINGDVHNPRRVQSDSIVAQVQLNNARSLHRNGVAGIINQNPPIATQDAQVMQVLTTAAQRVAQEAQSQVIASASLSPHEPGHELQALAKQQHVLTVTAQAFDQEVTGQRPEGIQQPPNVLAAAAQQVVFQAARQVAADRTAQAAIQMSVGITPTQPPGSHVTVNEVSVATQSAVAQAVEITGPLSSEVDVLMTASSLLEQQTRVPVNSDPGLMDPLQVGAPIQPARPHSTGTSLASHSFPVAAMSAPSAPALTFPPNSAVIPQVALADFPTHL